MSRAMIVILALAILLVSCTRGAPTDTDYHTGTSGMQLSLLEGYPDDKAYESEPLPVVLTLANAGAYDVPSNRIRLIFPYDPLYIDGPKSHSFAKKPDDLFYGRSFAYPEGMEETIDLYDFRTMPMVGLRETPSTKLTSQLCYEYRTDFAEEVCVDVDRFLRSGRPQVCEGQDISSSGQGAPVAFTNVVVRNQPVNLEGSAVYARPEFVVTVRNVGQGVVIGPPQADFASACSSRGIADLELNGVKVTARLLGMSLECKPEIVRLQDGEGATRCTVSDDDLGNAALVIQNNFYTPLVLTANYLYRETMVHNIEIMRAPGAESGRFLAGSARQIPGYAYKADGSPIKTSEMPKTAAATVRVDTGDLPVSVMAQGDSIIIVVPPEVHGEVEVSLSTVLAARIDATALGESGRIMASTAAGDVVVDVTSDEGIVDRVSADDDTLVITLGSVDGGQVTVQLSPSAEFQGVAPPVSSTASAGEGIIALSPMREESARERQMTMCEILANDPGKAEELSLTPSVKKSVESFNDANFACTCSEAQCHVLDDEGRCLYTLCPGSNYCCDSREKDRLEAEQRTREISQGSIPGSKFIVSTTAYFLPDCAEYSAWSTTGVELSGSDACRVGSPDVYGGVPKGFYEDVVCQGSGFCRGVPYTHKTIKPTEAASSPSIPQTAHKTMPEARRTVAVNDDAGTECYIPYGTRLKLDFGPGNPWNGEYVAEDTGSDITGCRIDVFVGAGRTALNSALPHVSNKRAEVTVLDWG